MKALTVTAAICTRNRPVQLARALDSLLVQSAAPAEILVVDNSPSDDATAKLVAERFPEVRYLCQPVPGLDFARNRALRRPRVRSSRSSMTMPWPTGTGAGH